MLPILRALRLAAALVLATASGALAQTVTLRDVSFDLGFAKVSIPRMEVQGASATEAELRALLDPAGAEPAVERLRRLNASSVTIPEIIMDQRFDGSTQRIVYRDARLDNIRAGVIGAARVAATTGEYDDKSLGRMDFRVGETVAEAVDLPQHAHALTGVSRDPQGEPHRALFRNLVYRDYVIGLPGGAGEIRVARMASREMRARAGRKPALQTIRDLMALAEKQAGAKKNDAEPTSEDLALMGGVFALMDNFTYGVVDIEGFAGRFDDGKQPGTFSIAGIRMSDEAGQAGFAMRDLRVEAGPARVVLAEMEARDFSLRETFRAAAELLEKGDLKALEENASRLIPKLGTIRFAGFDVQAPDPNARPRRQNDRNAQPDLMRASFKSLEFGVLDQLNGIPTALRFGAEELRVPLPANPTDDGQRQLRAMGITELNVGWLADLAWRRDGQRIDINSLSVTGKDLMSVNLTGRIGNVTPDAFAPDLTIAQIAWLGATAQRLSLAVENFGGFQKIVEHEARKARKQPDALRREWGTIAALGIPAILGDSDGVKSLASAVSRFIAQPRQLVIDVRSRDASGIGLADGWPRWTTRAR